MKYKNFFLLFFIISTLSYYNNFHCSSKHYNKNKQNNIKIENNSYEQLPLRENQLTVEEHDNQKKMEFLLQPIICTQSGLKKFIDDIYNNDLYREFLGSCFMHIIDLIDFAEKTSSRSLFIQESMYLFMLKMTQVSYVNPFAFLYFLQASNQKIIDVLMNEKLHVTLDVENYLKSMLVDDFDLLQKDSKQFIEKHSKEIVKLTENKIIDYSNLQFLYNNFIEQCCNLIVFDFTEYQETCDCFRKIIQDIVMKYETGIIKNEKTLHRILWILSSRFSYALSLQKNNLSSLAHTYIYETISTTLPKIMYEPESEEGITKKIDYIIKNLKL